MIRLAFFVSIILFPEIVLSQTAAEPGPGASPAPRQVIKIIRVRYGKAQTLADLTRSNSVIVNADDSLQAIVLKGDPPQVAEMEKAIHDLDVPSTSPAPQKDIELTVSVVAGSSNAEAAPVPEDMGPVVKQLRAIFPYKNYKVLGSMLLRSREGAKSENQGVMKSIFSFADRSYPTVYIVQYDDSSSSLQEGKALIHLGNFRFSLHFPLQNGSATSVSNFDVLIATDVDVREGKRWWLEG